MVELWVEEIIDNTSPVTCSSHLKEVYSAPVRISKSLRLVLATPSKIIRYSHRICSVYSDTVRFCLKIQVSIFSQVTVLICLPPALHILRQVKNLAHFYRVHHFWINVVGRETAGVSDGDKEQEVAPALLHVSFYFYHIYLN